MPTLSRRAAVMLASSAALAPLVGCSPNQSAEATPPAAAVGSADPNFNKLAQAWMDATAKQSPVSATQRGDHRFDAEFDDIGEAGRAARGDIVKTTTAALGALDRSN